ncbi:MAG TPA: ATP-binding protein [Candidatus Eisenbergiella intestinipullorum]|nr:ATP-binding protein [Candidatus Eisenbergiella intestinipullorum]
MKFGMDALVSISEKLLNRELKYGDSVIIGENSCGKSLLLKLLIQKAGKTDSIYFLDAVNRGFDVGKVAREARVPIYKRTIIETRIREDYFNLQDSFNCFGTWTERIEQIYYLYEKKLQDLFEKLTDERFRLIPGDVFGEVEFKEGKGLLSSGYQAIVHILLELLYYQEKCVEEKEMERAMVIIDELDEFLSPGYAYKIFPFLKEQFPRMEFIVTTHSADLVAGAQNANLIVLDEKGYEVMDINDCQSISEVQIIFDRVFGGHMPQGSEMENTLRRLMNNKINQAWTEKDQRQLEELKRENLTASQQLIYKQILEW